MSVAIAAVAVAVHPALACSCVAMTPEEALAQADVAFVGTVAEAPPMPAPAPAKPRVDPFPGGAPFGGEVPFTFIVEGVAKGDVSQPATVVGSFDSAACGMAFAPEERWLVFASLDGEALRTGLCSGSVALAPGEEPPVSLTPVDAEPDEGGFQVPGPLLVAGGGLAVVLAASYLAFRRRPTQ
jgi:hypothetical protein